MTTKTTHKKVAVAKSAPKNVAVKKVTPKRVEVVTVPGELAFWTIDGRALHSLLELADALRVMEGRVYRYHADKDHQDFAAWVGTVFQKKAVAKELKSATTPKAAEKIIRSALTPPKK